MVSIKSIRPIKELADVSTDHILEREGPTRMGKGVAAQIKDQVIQYAELLSLLYSCFKVVL